MECSVVGRWMECSVVGGGWSVVWWEVDNYYCEVFLLCFVKRANKSEALFLFQLLIEITTHSISFVYRISLEMYFFLNDNPLPSSLLISSSSMAIQKLFPLSHDLKATRDSSPVISWFCLELVQVHE